MEYRMIDLETKTQKIYTKDSVPSGDPNATAILILPHSMAKRLTKYMGGSPIPHIATRWGLPTTGYTES